MEKKEENNTEVIQIVCHCRNLGKFKPSSYGDDIPKQEKVFPFDAPCI